MLTMLAWHGWHRPVRDFARLPQCAANPATITLDRSKTVIADFSARPVLTSDSHLDGLDETGFRFTVRRQLGAVYQLQGASDLVNWTALGAFTNDYGIIQHTDPAGTNAPYRFYRALK